MDLGSGGRVALVCGSTPLPGLILSTTARAGVLGSAKALSDEVAADGITVNVVCPGFIATDLTHPRSRFPTGRCKPL